MGHTNNSITKTFVIDSVESAPSLSACTGLYVQHIYSCPTGSGDTHINLTRSGDTVFNNNIVPNEDDKTKLGTRQKRFRKLNTKKGESTVWTSTTINSNTINVDTVDLGHDGNEQRILNKLTSVLRNDRLNGGFY